MHGILLVAPALTLLLAGGAAAQEPKLPAPTPPELTKALAKAAVHNQRVLAILAADGDDTAAALKKNKTVQRPLLYEFETVQFTGEAAHSLAVSWQMPDAPQPKPALVVLDAGGKVLAKFSTGDFLSDGAIDGERLLLALKPHYNQPVDAEKKLAASIAEAKKTGRAVFARFDAPW